MDIRHLSHFLAVIEHRSVGKAAEQLRITQPALSKSIRRLEELLQVKLFDRGPDGMAPTVFGKTLADRARFISLEMKTAVHELEALRDVHRGSVTVGVGPSSAGEFVAAAVKRLAARRPEVRIAVMEGLMGTLFGMLRRGEVDFVVATKVSESPPEDIQSDLLFHDEVAVLAHAQHPLVRRGGGGIAALTDYPLVLTTPEDPVYAQLKEMFRKAGIEMPRPAIVTNSARFMKWIVQTGDYLVFVPRLLTRLEEQARLVAPVKVPGTRWMREVHVSRRARGTLSPAARALVAELRQVCRERKAPVAA